MSRVQLALNVDDLQEAVTFYSKLFGTEPAKVKPGYANFAIAEPPLKLVLIENAGKGGSINHLGVEVESSEKVHSEIARLTDEGLFTDEEIGTTCCFATQDKVWVTGPAGEKWEVYTVLADSEPSARARSCSTRARTRRESAAAPPPNRNRRPAPRRRPPRRRAAERHPRARYGRTSVAGPIRRRRVVGTSVPPQSGAGHPAGALS